MRARIREREWCVARGRPSSGRAESAGGSLPLDAAAHYHKRRSGPPPPLKINLLLLIEFFSYIYILLYNPSVFYKSVIRTNGLTIRREKKDDANMMTTRERERERSDVELPLWQARPPYLE